MIFGTQLCKWILIKLVNLLRCVPCTSLTSWRNVDVTEIMPFTVHVTLSPITMLQRDAKSLSSEMWPPSSPDLNPVDYSIWGILQDRVYRSRIHDVKELKERQLSEWRLLDHTIITAVIAQWRSHLNAYVRVNGGHFEHKFWASDFLLCFICFIDTGFRKCDPYKHVQSANIGVKCVTFVCETFTRYCSNITNVW